MIIQKIIEIVMIMMISLMEEIQGGIQVDSTEMIGRTAVIIMVEVETMVVMVTVKVTIIRMVQIIIMTIMVGEMIEIVVEVEVERRTEREKDIPNHTLKTANQVKKVKKKCVCCTNIRTEEKNM